MGMLCRALLVTLVMLAATAGMAGANARLISVTPLNGGCVAGPDEDLNAVQHWNIEPGQAYRITITDVVECGNGGTAPTLGVRMNSSSIGNTDLVATRVAPGTYQFDFEVPLDAACTMPIHFCTTPGEGNSGFRVHRNDGVPKQAHVRMASFNPGCTSSTKIVGSECRVTPTVASTWGRVKAIYR